MSFYAHTATGNARLALYDSNKNLLWESDSVAITASDDWQTVLIASGTPTSLFGVSAGTYYLAVQTDTDEDVFSLTTGSSGDGLSLSQSFGAFPASLSSATVTSNRWSVYATYTPTIVTISSGAASHAKKTTEHVDPTLPDPDVDDNELIMELRAQIFSLLNQLIEFLRAEILRLQQQ